MIKLRLHIIFCVMLAVFNISNSFAFKDLELITKTTKYTAGECIVLKFSNKVNNSYPSLYISNSFGSTLIKSNKESNILSYTIPSHMASRAGFINWILVVETDQLQGKLEITPKNAPQKIQTFVGPPSIIAGGKDFSMIVDIPIDAYDNPLTDGTKIAIKQQFKNKINVDTITIKNSICYKNIYSPSKTGRILVNSSCLGIESKEYDINIMPASPENFNISYNRHHDYADGNQITTFSSSIIKDKYSNLVSDGTYVQFFIKTSKGNVLKTSGTTINGSATAKIIHPNYENEWNVKAFINGIAESNSLTINYKSVISDFHIKLSNQNRNITVGPLHSFMNQIIPDGLKVTLYVYSKNKLVFTKHQSSKDGFAIFNLNVNQFPRGTYNITLKTAGISKSLNAIKL